MRVSLIDETNLGAIDEEFDYETIEDLAALISTEHWAPGLFADRKRTVATFLRCDLLVLDVDSGCKLEEATEKFKTYKHIIATSRNHQKDKKGIICDRFRVILFLSSPITNDRDFKATWNRAKKLWPFIDDACKDCSRFFFASPGVESINRNGINFEVSVGMETVLREVAANGGTGTLGTDERPRSGAESLVKGELSKRTKDFLINGAPSGARHTALVWAVPDMREQGYSRPEIISKIEAMIAGGGDWTQDHLSPVDMKTIERMFDRELKYPPRPKQESELVSGDYVSAMDLLDETFSYLADKDKVAGEPTGIVGLDTLLGGGFRTGELTVLMAQAKTGKNTLYHHLIYKHLERGMAFGYASRELNPATEVIPNLLSIALKENAWRASINDTFQSRSKQVLSAWALYFAPGYGHFATEDMERWFKSMRDLGITHYLFDHFHYALEGEDYEATAKLIKRLKTLTKELDIHLSLIVQPRSLREGEALSLATLRGGAAIGQALDNLLILERVRGETNISKLTLEVARHKLAKLGHTFLQYNPDTTEFIEVDRQLVSEAPPVPKGIIRRFDAFHQS